jgi:hypothetical protein
MPEKIKDWTSTLIWIIGLVFICGMTYQSIGSMGTRVTTNTVDIKANKQSIHDNELLMTGLSNSVRTTEQNTNELKTDFKELRNYLMQYDFRPKEQ